MDEDIKLLEANGWEVECQSPFEIRNQEMESFATGYAAEIVLDSLKDKQAQENKYIEEIAQEFVDGNNETTGQKNTIDTLFNFGSMGLRTPKELIGIFYNTFKQHHLL
jgi:hypothetical protein